MSGVFRSNRGTKMVSESTGGVTAPDWYPDPSHRHDFRYWDGNAWTSGVSDKGKASVDPVFTDPDAELIGVYERKSGPERTGTCRWRDVPHRALWEASLAETEVPRIASWAGLLATDRALLVAEKWPAAHLGHYTKLGSRVDRYEFSDISDIDEDGFDYAGTRKELSWKRDDKAHFPATYVGTPNGFLWVLLAQRPQLAPRLLVQQAEMSTSERRPVKVGHLVSGSGQTSLAEHLAPRRCRSTRSTRSARLKWSPGETRASTRRTTASSSPARCAGRSCDSASRGSRCPSAIQAPEKGQLVAMQRSSKCT